MSCGVDSKIQIMELSSDIAVETFRFVCPIPSCAASEVFCSGHTDEVNQIKCNSRRTALASCSDDRTARVWDVESIKLGRPFNNAVLTLEGHSSTVSSIAWCPWDQQSDGDILATCVHSPYKFRVRLMSVV